MSGGGRGRGWDVVIKCEVFHTHALHSTRRAANAAFETGSVRLPMWLIGEGNAPQP